MAEKFIAPIITVPKARLAFARIHEPVWRKKKDGTLDKGTPDKPKKPRYSCTLLIDPSDAANKPVIAAIKDGALKAVEHRWGPKKDGGWPKDNATTGTKGLIFAFGLGNDLPKVYDGFADMFYVKTSELTQPLLGTRRAVTCMLCEDGKWRKVDKAGNPILDEELNANECPYPGCYVRARISPWVFSNESSGVNFNIRSLQFVEPGKAFGGGAGTRNAEEEFEQLGAGEGKEVFETAAEADPFG